MANSKKFSNFELTKQYLKKKNMSKKDKTFEILKSYFPIESYNGEDHPATILMYNLICKLNDLSRDAKIQKLNKIIVELQNNDDIEAETFDYVVSHLYDLQERLHKLKQGAIIFDEEYMEVLDFIADAEEGYDVVPKDSLFSQPKVKPKKTLEDDLIEEWGFEDTFDYVKE